MKFAYADPPYLGLASYYDHPDSAKWDNPETHWWLIRKLQDEYDGWALSLHAPALQTILPMCPPDVRVAAWVKPFCSFKKHVNPAYAWEPVIFSGGRRYTLDDRTVRDWLSENITLKRGLVGAKPRNFARWIFGLLNVQPGDEFDDLFPGTNAIGAAWAEWCGEQSPLPALPLMRQIADQPAGGEGGG